MVQGWFEHNLDVYTRRARLLPSLIVVLPLVLSVLMVFANELTVLGLLVSILVCCGGTVLFAQVGRDMGKAKEESLFASWSGGKPTTRMLRHRTASNPVILAQRHSKLKELLPSIQIPSALEEDASPDNADQTYEACVEFLRKKTRDKEKFSLVFDENCNYGFRRNLWGMKPIGITTSTLAFLFSTGAIFTYFWYLKSPPPALAVICNLISLLLLVLWIFVFTPVWVKVPADAYAERLLEACDIL